MASSTIFISGSDPKSNERQAVTHAGWKFARAHFARRTRRNENLESARRRNQNFSRDSPVPVQITAADPVTAAP
jgi:hypothetical protein